MADRCGASEAELQAFVDERLTGAARRRMALHVATCARCQRGRDELERLGAAARALGLPAADADWAVAVRRRAGRGGALVRVARAAAVVVACGAALWSSYLVGRAHARAETPAPEPAASIEGNGLADASGSGGAEGPARRAEQPSSDERSAPPLRGEPLRPVTGDLAMPGGNEPWSRPRVALQPGGVVSPEPPMGFAPPTAAPFVPAVDGVRTERPTGFDLRDLEGALEWRTLEDGSVQGWAVEVTEDGATRSIQVRMRVGGGQ